MKRWHNRANKPLLYGCWLFCCLLFLPHFSLFSQSYPPAVNIETLTVEDGLSQSVVYSVAQDSKGFIWIGTFNGLDRYDGNGFIHFRHDTNDSFSIGSNKLSVIFEDSQQRLWIGTNDNGLDYFDRAARRFHHFFPGKKVINIAEDAAGGIYVDLNDTIARIEVWVNKDSSKEIVAKTNLFAIPNTSPTPYHVYSLLCADRNKNIFVTTQQGLFSLAYYHPAVQMFVFAQLFSYTTNRPLKLIPDNQTGKYYLVGDNAVLESNNSQFLHPVQVHKGIPYFGSTFVDRQSRLWYTGNDSTRIYDLRTGEESVFTGGREDFLNKLGNRSPILQDRSGTIWLTTPNSGLVTYSDDENIFHSMLTGQYIGNLKPIGEQSFVAMNKWLVRLKKGYTELTSLTKSEQEKYYYYDSPRNNDNGVCWHLEGDTLMVKCNRFNKKIFASPVVYHTYNALKSGSSTSDNIALRDTVYHSAYSGFLFFDNDACLWLYSTLGLVIYDTKHNEYHFVQGDSRFSFADDTKKRMYEDVNGTVWASIEQGIIACNKATGVVRYYLYKEDNAGRSLADKNITSFCDDPTDPQHIIWIGTRNGLSRMNKQTGVCRNFTEKDGLPNNVVYDIVPDSMGRLWMSTNRGLSCINTTDYSFRNFTVSDGLQGSEFNGNASLTLNDGTIVFGGTNGLTYFNPNEIKPLSPPLAVVTDVKAFGKSLQTASIKSLSTKDFSYATDVSVSYRDNVIAFEFAGIDYRKKNSLQYRYKLSPFDKDWNYSKTVHEATYTNLDPGGYTFEVETSNTNGIWGKESETLHVHILPLWWQTWWFYTLVAIVCFCFIYLVYRYQLNQALKVERVRNRIASDLHDEIGSTLSAITLFSEMAHRQSQTAVASPQLLERINLTSQKVTQTMRDIVWSVSTKNDSFEKMITHMHEHATELLELKDYELHFMADERLNHLNLSMEKRQNIYLIYKEALNNIIKYASGSNVWICLKKEKHHLLLSVKDDGVGFDAIQLNGNGNGLQNMKKRAASIGATIHVVSTIGKGCEMEMKIPV